MKKLSRAQKKALAAFKILPVDYYEPGFGYYQLESHHHEDGTVIRPITIRSLYFKGLLVKRQKKYKDIGSKPGNFDYNIFQNFEIGVNEEKLEVDYGLIWWEEKRRFTTRESVFSTRKMALYE